MDSESEHHKFQVFQASLLLEHLRNQGISISGKKLVDLGSGVGGYSHEFARNHAQVLSIDVFHPDASHSRNPTLIQPSAMELPIADETIDLIFCASLIEHLSEPAVLLSEFSRILKRGGNCYVSFPPYYRPREGHEFSPLYHFGERMAMRLVDRARKTPDWVRRFYNVPLESNTFAFTYDGFGLYG